MSPKPLSIDTGLLGDCGLRVAFEWRRDRYVHRLLALTGSTVVPLLSSVEGPAEDRWPPSPPVQQLSVEERGDGCRVALAVGMAGKSHWSAGVEVSGQRPRIVFDHACLVRQPPQRLGSCYVPQMTVECRDDVRCTFWLGKGFSVELTSELEGEKPTALLSHDAGQIVITPSESHLPLPSTRRWTYTLELSAPSDRRCP